MDVHVRSDKPTQWHAPVDPSTTYETRMYLKDDENTTNSRKHRSSNHVKSKPANPAVISSIIDSLDTLSAIVPANSDRHSPNLSRRQRASSPDSGTFTNFSFSRPRPSPIHITSNLNIQAQQYDHIEEYDIDDAVHDYNDDYDAALPPVVPTVRGGLGLAHYAPPHSPSYTFAAQDGYFSKGMGARRGSHTSIGTTESTKKKLSAESWVVKSRGIDDTLSDTPSGDGTRGRTGRKGLRRKNSQEMLRPHVETNQEQSIESFTAPLVEQFIISQSKSTHSTSASVTPRGRLYLRDSTLVDHHNRPSPTLHRTLTESTDPSAENDLLETPDEKAEDRRLSTLRASNSISDSIPTRTSSLRQASSSPGARRSKKERSKRPARPERSASRTPQIPESSWADLGEEDETVKRIMQLREQRKSRLQEFGAFGPPAPPPDLPLPALPASERGDSSQRGSPLIGSSSDHFMPNGISKTGPDSSTNSPKLGSSANGTVNGALHGDTASTTAAFLEAKPPFQPNDSGRWSSTDPLSRRPYSAHQSRPMTAKSENFATPSLSLEYSYADAVNVLQSLESELAPTPTRDAMKRLSFRQRYTDGQVPTVSSQLTRPLSRKSKKGFNHPDLPTGLDKKHNRRRSTGDPRQARLLQEEEMMRRDVEDEVAKFLSAPRLSCKLQNPQTGRSIAYSVVGDPNGAAVFVCVGMGLTRYVTAFYDELATTLQLRLITVDRPGVGGSEPCPSSDKSGPLGWPSDVLVICQHLGITRFSLLAHSAGAVYALATALILPHMVNGKVHLLAPWIPPSQLEAITHSATSAPPAGALPRGQRLLRVLPVPFFKAANASFMAASSASLKPTSKRKASQSTARRHNDLPSPPILNYTRPASAESRPDYSRRESMMLMDREMPATISLEQFPLPIVPTTTISTPPTLPSQPLLTATTSPSNPAFDIASTTLSAAEHAARARAQLYAQRLTEATWDLATRDSNPAVDLLVCFERAREVGFRYTDVARAVIITHGVDDRRVPLANVRWLAEQMNRHAGAAAAAAADSAREAARRAIERRGGGTTGTMGYEESGAGVLIMDEEWNRSAVHVPQSRDGWADAGASKGGCEVRALSGEGHGLMANPVIMGDVLTEIAEYWR